MVCLIMSLKVKSVKNTSHHSQAQTRRDSQKQVTDVIEVRTDIKLIKNSVENLNKASDLHFVVASRDAIDLVQTALWVCFY